MSGPDEFDPFVERLFRETPPMPDAGEFARGVERRLASSSRLRTGVLTLAGLVGGFVAVRETVGANLNFNPQAEATAAAVGATVAAEPENVRLADAGVGALAAQAQALQDGLGRMGLDFDFGAMAGMQLFWAVAALLIAGAAVAAIKLANEV